MSVELKALAAAQHGVVSCAQAHLHGYSPREIQRLCEDGSWWRTRRGIYLPAPEPSLETQPRVHHAVRVAAALLAVDRADAAAAHLSAAMLWNLDWLEDPDPTNVWLTWPKAGKVRRYDDLKVLTSALPQHHVTVDGDGLPVCTVARTVVDLARHLPFGEALVLADSAMRRWHVTRANLQRVLADCRRWPGVRAAERVVGFADGRAESVAESVARMLFAELGLPTPRLQVVIRHPDGLEDRVDFLFGERTVVEVDGKVKYLLDVDARWKEKTREDRIRELGYEVVRLTWADVRFKPDRVAALVRAALVRADRAAA
jgi:predicted transcriptional regulator of viral defense system